MSREKKERNNGLEFAIINDTEESRGVQVGVVNGADESRGVQAGIINLVVESRGVQAGVINYAGDSYGVQAGIINLADVNYLGKLRGVQLSPFLNMCGQNSKGVQLGAINWRNGGKWYSRLIPIVAIRRGLL